MIRNRDASSGSCPFVKSLSLSLDDDDDEKDDDDDDGDEDGDDDEDDGYDDDQTKMLQVCQISPEIIKRNFTFQTSLQSDFI